MSFIKYLGVLCLLFSGILMLYFGIDAFNHRTNIKVVWCNVTDYNIYTTTCNNNIQYNIQSYNQFNYNVLCHNLVLKCKYVNDTCLIHQNTYYNYDDAVNYYNNVTHEIRKAYWFDSKNCGNNIPNESNINFMIYGLTFLGGFIVLAIFAVLIGVCFFDNYVKYDIYKSKRVY